MIIHNKVNNISDNISTKYKSDIDNIATSMIKLSNVSTELRTEFSQLQAIYNKYKVELCNIILERRGLLKLISTYVDKLPNCINPKDNKLHAKFDQLGAQTGRFSSRDPNLQNIPSKNKEIRMMFRASEEQHTYQFEDTVEIALKEEVLSDKGWKPVTDVVVGDSLSITDDGETVFQIVTKVEKLKDSVVLTFRGGDVI